MGMRMLQALWWAIIGCFLLIQESAGETTHVLIPNVDLFIGLISPTPEPQPTNDTGLQPPLNVMPPSPPSPLVSPPSPDNDFVPSSLPINIIPPLSSTPPSPLFPPPSPDNDFAPQLPPINIIPPPPPSPDDDFAPAIPPINIIPPPPPSPDSEFVPPLPPINIIPPPPPSPDNDSVPSLPPFSQPELAPPPSLQPPPEPLTPPSSSAPPTGGIHEPPPAPKSVPPSSHDAHSVAPVSSPQAPRRMPAAPPPESPVLPKEPPSSPPDSSKNPAPGPPLPQISPSTKPISAEPPSPIPPDSSKNPAPSPPLPPQISPPIKPISAEPPSSNPPEQNPSPMLAPPPSIISRAASAPVSAPAHKAAHHVSPVRETPTQAPTSEDPVPPTNTPPPRPRSRSKKATHESQSPAPLPHDILPPSGSSSHEPPITSPVAPCGDNCSDPPASKSTLTPFVSPKKFPSAPPRRSPTPPPPPPPPFESLPPPPPQKDCGPLTCTEPLTYGPPQSPCICVYPIQVGLRLGVALYTFFPSVSELASEIAYGVSMNSSQVRVMGADAAGENPDKTNVVVYLLPIGNKFDYNTAYFTFERFWLKQVVIKASLFGDYDVLYVKYPGLPPSPPLPPSFIATKPYSGGDNSPRTLQQPLGIDVSGKHHKKRPNRSILAIIILSALLAMIVVTALAWAFVSRYRRSNERMETSPPSTARSLAKASVIGNGPESPPVSMSSSLTAYTGSARTFSLNDLLRATDCFNESRILGEGGFGCVYRGTLEDGTKVAMKVLKRNDQQGAREFLAEVEMLSRLHHRNLVKLIGICVEDRTRCLVYELIPNGSLESHLHGADREISPLDWRTRLKIALGAARALAYLHEDSSPPVIHRDFKTSNILLEDDFTPKVSDFGLARNALNERNKHISTHVMGTFGYVAPEYAMTGHLLVKSDVYSYGVVLLELLTGKKPVDMSQPSGLENLVSWARPMLTNPESLRSIVDRSLGPDVPFDSVAKVAAIASMCVQPEVSHRPFMGEVVQALTLMYEEDTKGSRRSSFSSREDNLLLRTEDFHAQSPPVSRYDCGLEVERDLSVSELLSSPARYGMRDFGSLRRHSSSGPMRTSRAKHWWKNVRRMSGASSSEHGIMLKLWPGSH